MIMHGVAMEN